MLQSIRIQGFRAFRELRIEGLAQLNLIVGTNNSGKTSVLEAIQFAASGGNLSALLSASRRRGERAPSTREDRVQGFDVRHAFFGRHMDSTPGFSLETVSQEGLATRLEVSAVRVEQEQLQLWKDGLRQQRLPFGRPNREPTSEEFDRQDQPPRFLVVRANGEIVSQIPLRLDGSLAVDDVFPTRGVPSWPVHFITTQSLAQARLARLLDEVVLTREEEFVVHALNAVENNINRIAAIEGYRESREIVVGLKSGGEALPLGSLGDGMLRMMAIALSLVAAKDGYLLVDEIDTGLHHSVMKRMWTLVMETAQRLNVCVVATTHSYDCVHALSSVARSKPEGRDSVALIRVERDRASTVHFSEVEIANLRALEIEPR